MAGLAPVELSADCPACGLEGGVAEVYDARVAACRFGLPATARCKLCTAESEGMLDRAPAKAIQDIPANRCPACLHVLTPAAIDERCCSACGARASSRRTSAATTFASVADLERALDQWAERERFPSRHALIAATFTEPDVAKLFATIQRKAPIEILADPFANMGVRTTGGSAQQKREAGERPARDVELAGAVGRSATPDPAPASDADVARRRSDGTASDVGTRADGGNGAVAGERADARARVDAGARTDAGTRVNAGATAPIGRTVLEPGGARTEPLAPPSAPPRSAPPRSIVYPLVSVIAADGEIHPEERALIDRFLQSEGLAPLAEHEFCVHHPSEVAHLVPKERREDVVKLMCESAAIDGLPDESERRVIRAYATAWGVDDEKLEFWMWGYESMNTSLARQLFLKLRRFVLSARWNDADTSER